MRALLDAGAFIAIERGNREALGMLAVELLAGRAPVTHGGVIGQVWRDGSLQARLAKALRGIEVVPLDGDLGRRAGLLLARSGTNDVIDAALVALAQDGDEIHTSDLDDIAVLTRVADLHVDLIPR